VYATDDRRWPGVVKPDTKCDKYLIIEDFYPTILEMAQIKHYKTVQPIDGISFKPLLTHTGDPSKGRSLHWNFPNHWGNTVPASARPVPYAKVTGS